MHPSFAPTHVRMSSSRPVARLARQIGIGDQGSRHADDVDLPCRHDPIRVFRVDDAARVKDRQPGRGLLDRGRQRHEDARRVAHVRDGCGLQLVGVGAAADDREKVDQARRREPPRDLGHIGRREAAPRKFVARDAGAHDEVAADPAPHLSQHLEAEAHAVLEAPAVLVEPLVEQRRPELVDQVVVRHRELDAVEPGFAAAERRRAEGAHELGDLLGFELVRHVAMHALGDLRRRQQHVRLLAVGLRSASHVRELGEDEASVRVHGLGERAVRRDDRVVVIRDLLPRRGGRRGMHARGAAEDRERAAAARLGRVIAREAIARPAALGHRLGMAG